jgi:hypothetical protein
MMPQARQNNQGIWAKNVEEPTRLYVKRAAGDVTSIPAQLEIVAALAVDESLFLVTCINWLMTPIKIWHGLIGLRTPMRPI